YTCPSCCYDTYPLSTVSNCFFIYNDPTSSEVYSLSLHDALPIWRAGGAPADDRGAARRAGARRDQLRPGMATGGAGRDVRAGVHHDGRTSHAETPLTGDAMPLAPTKAVHTWSLFRTMCRLAAPGSAPSGVL